MPSFQRVVVTALVERTFTAARRYGARSVGVAGGVSANSRLRADLKSYGDAREMPTFVPSLRLSTDNAAMIAAAGLRQFRLGAALIARHQRGRRRCRCEAIMTVFTDYLWFNTKKRQEFIRITDEIAGVVAKSGVKEGTVLVSAMHITAGRLRQRLGTGVDRTTFRSGSRSWRRPAATIAITRPAKTTPTRI